MNMIKEKISIAKANADLNKIRGLVAKEVERVNQVLIHDYHSTVPVVNEITEYIVKCGGKHLRPLVLLLMANTFNYHEEASAHLAAAIEFIHTASLLHDDVVDDSSMRRGHQTASTIWSNAKAVLVGDFLYTFAINKISNLENTPTLLIFQAFAAATNQIVEGEVIQLINRRNINIDEDTYLTILYRKTGKLFELAAHVASLLGNANPEVIQAAKEYGKRLGVAFQLIDDMLDYSANAKKLGKNLGDDLAEGSPTLPLIYAFKHAEPKQREIIQQAIETGNIVEIQEIIDIVINSGAITYTAEYATKQAELALLALEKIPASPYRDGLATLAHFAVRRDY